MCKTAHLCTCQTSDKASRGPACFLLAEASLAAVTGYEGFFRVAVRLCFGCVSFSRQGAVLHGGVCLRG